MKQLLFCVAVLTTISCNNSNNTNSTEKAVSGKDSPTTLPEPAPVHKECYAQQGRDTVLLQLTKINEVVTGNLYIHREGKDINNGTISGNFKGDTLIADYTFNSEGVSSVRQVVFLQKDSSLIEGYGEISEKNNRVYFTNRSAIRFEETMRLNRVPCTR